MFLHISSQFFYFSCHRPVTVYRLHWSADHGFFGTTLWSGLFPASTGLGTVHVCVGVCERAGECGQDVCISWLAVPGYFSRPPTAVTLLVPRTLEMPLLQLEQKPGRNAWRERYVMFAFCLTCFFFICILLQDVPWPQVPSICIQLSTFLLTETGKDWAATARSWDGAKNV